MRKKPSLREIVLALALSLTSCANCKIKFGDQVEKYTPRKYTPHTHEKKYIPIVSITF